MKSLRPLSVLIMLLIGLACTHAPGQADPRGSEEPGEPEQENSAMKDPLEMLVDEARSDLRKRLSIAESEAESEIEVVSAKRVTWRDSSLGCPKKGSFYMQALQPGILIELRVKSTIYSYHGKPEGPPFYCQTPSPAGPLPSDTE